MEPDDKDLYTVTDIAKKLKKSSQAIHKQIRSRKIPFRKFGKTFIIHKSDLYRFLE